jgi:hypothetical protein
MREKDNLNKLYLKASKTIKCKGVCYTQEEFNKNKGKIYELAGYFHSVNKKLDKYE